MKRCLDVDLKANGEEDLEKTLVDFEEPEGAHQREGEINQSILALDSYILDYVQEREELTLLSAWSH